MTNMSTSCIYKKRNDESELEYHFVFAIGAMANLQQERQIPRKKWQREALFVSMFVSLSPEKELHCCQ